MERINIARFGGILAPSIQQHSDLKQLVERCEDLYPGIGRWFRSKVASGLQDKKRTAYLIYRQDKPVGAVILKLGLDAKICSFRILPEAERQGLGKLLMALIARDLRVESKYVHFTIPHHIWEEKFAFFSKYGFVHAMPSNQQYRLFDEEFFCRGNFSTMWAEVINSLPTLLKDITINGFCSRYNLIMSMRPAYAAALLRGRKTVEIRRRFATKWTGATALVYSSHPESSFVGSFRISNVVEGSPDEIWRSFGPEIGCSHEEFRAYAKGTDRVYAIIADDRFAFRERIPSWQVNHLLKRDFSVPQSYSKVRDGSELEDIGSISALLQATL